MTNITERLREETQTLHEQTEQLLFVDALRGGTLTADEYYQLLLTHFAYHSALETAIDMHSVFFAAYEPESRRKTPWLQTDLAQLQLAPPTTQSSVFEGWSPSALLGAAYVGEGSMLGGKTVWHYLQHSSAILPLLDNARFYRGYGPETGPKWKAFLAFLSQQSGDHTETIVQGAKQAFLAYHTLFDQIQHQWASQPSYT
jgi:heme oxygenase